KKDFPYIQPGPADVWAGGKRHSVTILFAVKGRPAAGTGELIVDFVDTHSGQPPRLEIKLNEAASVHQTPRGAGDASAHGEVDKGREYLMRIPFDAEVLRAGNNTLTITSLEGSWVLFDYLRLTVPDGIEAAAIEKMTTVQDVFTRPYLVRREGKLYQPVLASVVHVGDSVEAMVAVEGGLSQTHRLVSGTQVIEGLAPAVEKAGEVSAAVKVGGKTLFEKRVALEPVRKWEIYLLHQTHLDIGYTHVQTEVEEMQWQFLDEAIELGEKTKDYPAEARFKWLPEGLWAVDSYLKNASPEKEARFIDAVKKGYIGLDALYGNELTALCRPEELLELTGYARRLAKKHGLTIDSAMITDVPGYTWGIVPVLAQSGVKYFSIGPNFGHRIGYTLSEWGDKPFYWESPSGKERILCWMAGMGYSWFHTGLNYTEITRKLEEGRIFDYLKRLENSEFAFDIVQVRYNIGSDNGPPDPQLPDMVKAWNEKYAYPRMMIASPSEMFAEFEKRYADKLPTVRGDFTPYWEDGAASSARETALTRAAAERLVQAQTMFAMTGAEYPAEAFHAAWREVLLYDEHTWGSWNSISEPECDFTKQQWAIKQAFALEADQQSGALLAKAVEPIADNSMPVQAVQVFNTCSWPRKDLVVLPKEMATAGDQVRVDDKVVPSQRLTSGELAFVAQDVSAFGSASFAINEGKALTRGAAKVSGNTLSNGIITLTIDKETGAIASLRRNGIDGELVDAKGGGLNSYLYVEGRDPKDPKPNEAVTIRAVDKGPLVASLEVTCDAPGCNKLVRTYRVVDGLDHVEVIDLIDKKDVYAQEGVHLGFAFNVPGGVLRMETPWAVVRPEADQLAGACKNYFTVQRWVDISNDDYGVTWATLDAPLIEIGRITNDPRSPVGWIKELEPSMTFYSYVMNNYWETNYKASQSGEHVFRYAVRPHGGHDSAAATRFGMERSCPLLAVPAKSSARTPGKWAVRGDGVVCTALKPSDDGKAMIMRLYNVSGRTQTANVGTWLRGMRVWKSNLDEEQLKEVGGVEMAPWEIVTFRILAP
ncbi:MAG: hypothetical protein IH624_08195, partial [Phycisphaerae bacterium]|nr:hypothetical protein [Phycisphaerae bacterium]